MRTRTGPRRRPLRSALAAAGAMIVLAGGLALGTAGGAGAISLPFTWTAATHVAGSMLAVSCTSAKFCVAEDAYGNAYVFHGSAWSSGTSVEPTTFTLSCAPGTEFCAAVDSTGQTHVFNGTTWSPSTSIGSAIAAISCPTSGACVGVGQGGHVELYNGSTWSAGTTVATAPTLGTVSCPSASFCMAGSTTGRIYELNGGTWSLSASVSTEGVIRISCGSATNCIGTLTTGDVTVYNGSSWSAPSRVDGIGLYAVSCASTGFCGATATTDGDVTTYSSGSWSAAVKVASTNSLADISCVSNAFCAAVNFTGNVNIGRSITAGVTKTTLNKISLTMSSDLPAATDVSYTWSLTSTGTLQDLALLELEVPVGTSQDPLSITSAYGLDATGATVSLNAAGSLVTVRLPAQKVTAGTRISLSVAGFTNASLTPPTTPITITPSVVMLNATGTVLASGTSSPTTISSATTQVTVTVPESLQFTNSAPDVYIEGIPDGGTARESCTPGGSAPCPVVLGVKTNAANGYTVTVEMASGLKAGASTFPQDSTSGSGSTLAAGTFGAEVSATSFSSAGTGTASLSSPHGLGDFVGYQTTGPSTLWSSTGTTGDTADQVSVTNAANPTFATPEGVYTGAVTYTANPNY
jgi:hypothetical protein